LGRFFFRGLQSTVWKLTFPPSFTLLISSLAARSDAFDSALFKSPPPISAAQQHFLSASAIYLSFLFNQAKKFSVSFLPNLFDLFFATQRRASSYYLP
jgi:hypothetical protein